MSPDLAPASPASPWMKHLERAHDRALAAARSIEEQTDPSDHLAPAARKLERGLSAMYDAFDGRADRPTAIGVAHGRLWDAAVLAARAGLPGALAWLREACAELVAAESRMPRVPIAALEERKIQAGRDRLMLHAIARESLSPSFRAPPLPEPEDIPPPIDLPEPTTFEELAKVAAEARRIAQERADALVERMRPEPPAALGRGPSARDPAKIPEGFAHAPEAIEERVFVQRWARECLDEIGMIGLQRAPLAGDDWRSSRPLERRMIAAIDAIAALGPIAIAEAERLAMDAPVVNPMSVFAVAMVGGCLEGRDAIAAAERVLHRFGAGDPMVAGPFVSAMKIAPSPFVPSVLRSLFASSDPACRAIAVEGLAHLRLLDASDLGALADEADPRLLDLALPALAIARHADFGRAADRALAHDDAHLRLAALDAMAIAAHPRAASAAREAAAGGRSPDAARAASAGGRSPDAARAAAEGSLGDRALVRLAIVASEDDARWLLDRMRAAPTPAAIEAVGWAGLVDSIPALIDLLESEDDKQKLAAGAALDRLLGAGILQSIEIQPEALDDVVIVDPDPEALATIVSHPRDVPPNGSTETLEVPSTDPAMWRAYWREHGGRFDPRQRLRRGQAYSPSVSLYELDRLPLSMEDRRALFRELAARTGKLASFDPSDLVSVQEESLAAWGAILKATSETLGSWARPVR